jgi:hypothetical protein
VPERRSLRNLQRTLYVIAWVPILAGLWTVVAGGESIPAAGDLNANVESELRFYSVWWIGAGIFLLWLVPQVAERTRELRVFCALLFLGAVSRLFAVLDTDWPSTGQIVLMGIEFALAIGLPLWQARVTRPES